MQLFKDQYTMVYEINTLAEGWKAREQNQVSDTPGVEKHTFINENNKRNEWHHDSGFYQWLPVMRNEIAKPGSWNYQAWLTSNKTAAQSAHDAKTVQTKQ